MNTRRLRHQRITPLESYEKNDETLEIIETSECVAWALTPGQTTFIPEVEDKSFVSKLLNFGIFAFLFMIAQFFLHAKMTYTACKEAYLCEEQNQKNEWVNQGLKHAFKTLFIGLAIIASFFVLSILVLPVLVTLSTYDVLSNINQLWVTRNDHKLAKTLEQREQLLTARNRLWYDLGVNCLMLVFSVFSCLYPPIFYTIGTVGCTVVKIIPHLPAIWSSIKSFCHTLKNKITHTIEPSAKKEPACVELTTYQSLAKQHVLEKPMEANFLKIPSKHRNSERTNKMELHEVHKRKTENNGINNDMNIGFFKKSPECSTSSYLSSKDKTAISEFRKADKTYEFAHSFAIKK